MQVTLCPGTRLDIKGHGGDIKVQGDGETNLAVLVHNPTETAVPSVSPSQCLLLLFSYSPLSSSANSPVPSSRPPSCNLLSATLPPPRPPPFPPNCLALTLALDPAGVTISSITLGSHGCMYGGRVNGAWHTKTSVCPHRHCLLLLFCLFPSLPDH